MEQLHNESLQAFVPDSRLVAFGIFAAGILSGLLLAAYLVPRLISDEVFAVAFCRQVVSTSALPLAVSSPGK